MVEAQDQFCSLRRAGHEKAFNNVVTSGLAQTGPGGALFRMAMREFDRWARAKEEGRDYSSASWVLAKALVFPKIHAKLRARFGGRIQQFVSGGAPLVHYYAGRFAELLGDDTAAAD